MASVEQAPSYPRERKLDATYVVPAIRTISSGPGCTTAADSIRGSRFGVYKRMSDIVTPGFQRLSNSGRVINNPCTIWKTTFSPVMSGRTHQYGLPFDCATGSGNWKVNFSNFLGYFLDPLPLESDGIIPVEDLITDVSTRARANVKDPSVQGLAFLGEIQKTLALLRNPLASIQVLLKKYNRSGAGVANAASSQSLAILFGLLPLMHDIEGIVEALQRQVQERETARASASDEFTSLATGQVITGGNLMNVTTHESVTVRAGSLYEFSGRSILDSLGLTLSNLPAAIWELTPWSFVVDWFTNVGKVISALQASASNEFLAEWVTIKRIRTVTRAATVSTVATNWVETRACTDVDKVVYETYNRIPMNLGKNIGFVLNLHLNRVNPLAAISLITQQLTKRKT